MNRVSLCIIRSPLALSWCCATLFRQFVTTHINSKDPYQVLGLPPTATIPQIKRRFLELAKKNSTFDTADELDAITDAYETLTTGNIVTSTEGSDIEVQNKHTFRTKYLKKTPFNVQQAPYKDTVVTQRHWNRYQQIRTWYIQSEQSLTPSLREEWGCAIRRFQLARVVSWQVDCSIKGQSAYLLCENMDQAIRYRTEEIVLWESWEREAKIIEDWVRAHPDAVEICDNDKKEKEFRDEFESDRAKAVISIAFEDWCLELNTGHGAVRSQHNQASSPPVAIPQEETV